MTEKIVQFGDTPGDRRVVKATLPPEEPEIPQEPQIDPDFQAPTKADEVAAVKLSTSQVQAAVQLRLFGASYPEIAETLGYVSPSTVRLAVVKAIADTHANEADYKALRGLMSMRYEGLLKSLAPNAFKPTVVVEKNGKKETVPNELHLPYLREARAVLKDLTVLHGLNAPQVHAFVNPDSEQFEAVVGAIADKFISENMAPEGDIFELEETAPDEFGEPDGQ